MKYIEVKNLIKQSLEKNEDGLTWSELKEELSLPYKTLCPEWTKSLEEEISLVRDRPSDGRAFVWKIKC